MKVFTFVLIVYTLGLPTSSLSAHDELIQLHYEGETVMAKQLVKGHLDLFVSTQYEEKRVTGPQYRKQKTAYVKRYFLKYDDVVEKITPYNYKKILRRHLPDAPELHQRLGRPGFRYENLSSIIRYYNTFKTPELEPEPAETPTIIGMER